MNNKVVIEMNNKEVIEMTFLLLWSQQLMTVSDWDWTISICRRSLKLFNNVKRTISHNMSHDIPRYTTRYHEIPRYTTIYHDLQRYTTIYHDIPPDSTRSHEIPETIRQREENDIPWYWRSITISPFESMIVPLKTLQCIDEEKFHSISTTRGLELEINIDMMKIPELINIEVVQIESCTSCITKWYQSCTSGSTEWYHRCTRIVPLRPFQSTCDGLTLAMTHDSLPDIGDWVKLAWLHNVNCELFHDKAMTDSRISETAIRIDGLLTSQSVTSNLESDINMRRSPSKQK